MNYFNEGNKSYNNKDYKKAIDCYKKAAESQENGACSYYNSGVCFIKLKEYNKAIIMLKKAIEIQRESKYFFNLGYSYAMLDEKGKAIINFNIAWSLNNDDEDCKRAINLITSKIC